MPRLTVGDRIRLSGGYFNPPDWLCGSESRFARVRGFFDNQIEGREADSRISAAIEFEEELEFEGLRARHGFILGRWAGQNWDASGVVHLHLCDRLVSSAADVEEARTVWLESHASYKVDAV